MFKFGVENLRRLKNVEMIDLRPITVLVGRNSAGKSTFLRSFALLRQSIVTRISSPILWYGDIVDFGSFKGSVYANDPDLNITFSFGLDSMQVQQQPFLNPFTATYVARYDLRSFSGVTLRVSVSSYHLRGENTLPSAAIERISEELRQPMLVIAEMITPFLDKRLKSEAIQELALSLLSMGSFDKEAISRSANETSVKSWQKLLLDIADKDKHGLYSKINHIFLSIQFRALIREVSSRLKSTLSQTLYIGPARARSERYYRYQDLSVSEIDADGKNFPMFLNSLSKSQQNNLSDWVERLFNYRINLEPSGGHISINLIEVDSVTNIVDTGYGVS